MKKCKKCGQDNRPAAKYCRHCGCSLSDTGSQPVDNTAAHDALDAIVGMEEVKAALRKQVAKYKAVNSRRLGGAKIHVPFDMLICGDPGVGKTALVNAVAQLLFDAGITKKAKPVMAPVDSGSDEDKEKAIADAAGGLLVLDRVNKIMPDNPDDYASCVVCEGLVDHIKDYTGDDPDRYPAVVVFTGNKQFYDYTRCHPVYDNAFTFVFTLNPPTVEELVEICRRELASKFKANWTPEAIVKLKNVFAYMLRDTDSPFGNGYAAVKKARQTMQEAVSTTTGTGVINILPDHIPGKEFIPRTLDEVMAEFDKYVGVEEIKADMKRIAALVDSKKESVAKGEPLLCEHFMFLGNPGTGKTTMARLFADALTSMGVLPVGQLVEVARKDLVGKYVGHTAPLVEDAFNRAEGGVLFIDEAYDLKNDDQDSFGQEAVNTLIKLAEDRRGRVVIILAGYTKEMGEFCDANSGIKSRFSTSINFRDYTGEELEEIFRRLVKGKGYTLADDTEAGLGAFFKTMYLKRTKNFGNAREVRNAFDKAVGRLATRMADARANGSFDAAKEKVLTMADIEGDDAKPQTVEEILAKFDDLVGMADVKEQIRSIATTMKFERMRMLSGKGKTKLENIHIAITGNPGTGKTTVAKRLGEVFKAMGVLTSSRVVERERKNLITAYQNSGATNMNKAVDEAMGGILFIDEVYNLYKPSGMDGDKAGLEAVEALMSRMTADAGKFVTVIAGYKREVDWFIANANPGLSRRFTYRIHIDDYDAWQLTEILRRTAEAQGFQLTPEAEEAALRKFEQLVADKAPNFGNAGVANNLFDRAKQLQSLRLSEIVTGDSADDDLLFTITAEDIPMDYQP